MIEYSLIFYLIGALIFFATALRGGKDYSLKVVLAMLLLSIVWPFVLCIFYLSDRD